MPTITSGDPLALILLHVRFPPPICQYVNKKKEDYFLKILVVSKVEITCQCSCLLFSICGFINLKRVKLGNQIWYYMIVFFDG